MDNLTHTLIGVGIARTGLSEKWGRGTTLILAIASNLPDLDVAFLSGGPLAFLWRRAITHSVLGMTVLALLGTALFRRIYPNLSWKQVAGLVAIGVLGHVFADLWNSYGVVLLWPFQWKRFELEWVFIIDLAIWGILAVSLLLSLIWRQRAGVIWRAGLGALAIYIAVCASARALSENLVLARASADQITPVRVYLYPEPFGPQRFRGVVTEAGSARYSVYIIEPFRNKIELLEQLEAEEKAPVVEAARKTQAGQRLDRFFSTPVWRMSPDGTAAVVYGLGFRSHVLVRRSVFEFLVTAEGQVSPF